jgi:HK97 family phage portal protein
MEGGMEFKPVTVNPRDAQMLETRQFNVLEICRFFGVPPSKAFAQEGLTYSNVEAYQLGFVTDTVTPMDSRIESEFNRKLCRPSLRGLTVLSLNPEALLKANLDSMANYLSKMFQSGGYTPNEIRQKLGMEKKAGGDDPFVQVNMMKLNDKNSGEGNKKPGSL